MILAIIPARKESKRLPNKNKLLLNGKPLISYTIEEAIKSKYINTLVVSTDDQDIIEIAKTYNIDYHERKPELAGDDIPLQDVIDDVKLSYNDVDYIVLLQTTNPLKLSEHIDACIEICLNNNYKSSVAVKYLDPYHIFIPIGSIFVCKTKLWEKPIGVYCLSDEYCIDIDTDVDFKIAEYLMEKRK